MSSRKLIFVLPVVLFACNQETLTHDEAVDALASRILPPLLYGEGHPYAIPFTGSGTEASVSSLTRDQLVRFHQTWFKPGSATSVPKG